MSICGLGTMVDRLTEVSTELVLMVPRKALYEFLRKNEHAERMTERTSRVSAIATQPSSQISNRTDTGLSSTDTRVMTEKLTKMARANPWLGKEMAEIIRTLSNAEAGPKGNPPPVDAVTFLRLCKAHIVEDVPPSRLAFEADIGGSITRYEVGLSAQDEGTKVMLSVNVKPPADARTAGLMMDAAIQELCAFDIGYRTQRISE